MGLSTYVFVPTSHGRMTESVSHAMLRASVVFGFTAALLEDIPVIGLAFTVSNRIGAAMWAHGTLLFRWFSVQIYVALGFSMIRSDTLTLSI